MLRLFIVIYGGLFVTNQLKVYFASANVPIDYIPRVPMNKWYTHSLVYQTKEMAGKILEDT